jgi:hypothetical protein
MPDVPDAPVSAAALLNAARALTTTGRISAIRPLLG